MSVTPFEADRDHLARQLALARESLPEPEQDALRMAISDARRNGVPLQDASPPLLRLALEQGKSIMALLADADEELEPGEVQELEQLVETMLPNL